MNDAAPSRSLAAWRSARRAAARQHHPDVGGDPGALDAALAEVDRRFGRVPGPAEAGPTVTVRSTRGHRLRRRVARTVARLRTLRPGASRRIDI